MRKNLGIILRGQSGQALPIALAMLAIGSLIVVPLLNLTETSLRSGIREGNRMYENYAANAGVMDGIREIITDNPALPAIGDNWTYSIPNTNSRSVNVTIATIEQSNWEITSTATSGSGDSTELNCWVEKVNYLPNAINSANVTIETDAVVNGNVRWDSTVGSFNNQGIINGKIIDKPIQWPTLEEVSAFYLDQVQDAPILDDNLFLFLGPETLGDPYSLGPIHIKGNLAIWGSPYGAVRLDGTVYVEGNVEIWHNVNVYMNNNTIFNEGNFWISPFASVYEHGCIVTVSNLIFNPDGDPDACLILWSVNGHVFVGSWGREIYGAAYSPVKAKVASDSILTYVKPPTDLLLPPPPLPESFRIAGWESNSQ